MTKTMFGLMEENKVG